LGVGFDAVDAAGAEEEVKVVVEAVDVGGVDDGHRVARDAFLFVNDPGLVGFCEGAGGGDATPVAQLESC